MKYSIDTSAILDGWQRYYPPDVIPGLWEKLEELIDKGDLIATEEVLIELKKKEGDVAYKWAKKHDQMFIPIDSKIQIEVTKILGSHRKLIDTRKNRSAADPFVIALAIVENCKVVTGERPTTSLTRPHIPDVCRAMNVPWIDLVQLCREQGWTFN